MFAVVTMSCVLDKKSILFFLFREIYESERAHIYLYNHNIRTDQVSACVESK